jgi:DNA repair exonuclease SbcCD ATPase subunit
MDTLEEIEDEQNHIKEHIREVVRHFRRLEIQKAKLGDSTPPNIHNGIEDDKRTLKQLDQKREMLAQVEKCIKGLKTCDLLQKIKHKKLDKLTKDTEELQDLLDSITDIRRKRDELTVKLAALNKEYRDM